MGESLEWSDFDKVKLVVGTILEARDFPEAKKPAYKLLVDLGSEFGLKKSSVQITDLYTKEELVARQVLCIVNFKPRQIGPFMSKVLTTGFVLSEGVVLASCERQVPNGTRLS